VTKADQKIIELKIATLIKLVLSQLRDVNAKPGIWRTFKEQNGREWSEGDLEHPAPFACVLTVDALPMRTASDTSG